MLSWLALNWVDLCEKAFGLIGLASAFVAGVSRMFPNWKPASKAGRALAWLMAFAGRVALNPKPPAA